MPRSERERAPSPFKPAARVNFQFEPEGRRQLSELLAEASPNLMRPGPIPVNVALAASGRPIPNTPAGFIIAAAEEAIQLLLSVLKADRKAVPGNPANYRAAIGRLRTALKPFTEGRVDRKTTRIADWRTLDYALAERYKELAALKRPAPYERRQLQERCEAIAVAADTYARFASVELSEAEILHFVWLAMSLAEIGLPHPNERRARLRKFVFG